MDRSCGGGRTGGVLEMRRIAWCLLLGRRSFGLFAALTPRAAITIAAIETIATVEPATAALVAFAIPVDFAHHRGGAFLVLVNAHRQMPQHVFGEALLPLDLGHRRGRRIELEQREVRLAVLADAEGEGLDAPIFGVADELAAEAFDDAFEVGRHLLHLLCAEVLARQIDVFVQWHGMPFPCYRSSGAKPLVPFGKGSKALRKAGTRDAGPCSPTSPSRDGRPFSSRPGSSGERGL